MNEPVTIEIELPVRHERNIFGHLDTNVRKIERELGISVVARDGSIRITGDRRSTEKARRLFAMLLALSERGNEINAQNLSYSIALLKDEDADTDNEVNGPDAEAAGTSGGDAEAAGTSGSAAENGYSGEPEKKRDHLKEMFELDDDILIHTMSGRPVKPKTLGQKEYVDSIRANMITFGIGPAGTGKTYLAMAMAIRAFRAEEVSRIILTRPAIEAGEKLGFLPGDLQSKIDPYLRPLYDALYDIMGAEAFARNSEKGLIEVAPLAYMRGRTLDNAFIILDEAQNTTPAQMKMFLTRIGFGSKVVVTGDRTQKDLPSDMVSGLDNAERVLKKIDGIGFSELTSRDVVRHPLVQKIVEAYEKYEKNETAKRNERAAARVRVKRR